MPRYIDADAIHYVEIGKGVEIALASDIDKIPTVSPDEVPGVGEWTPVETEFGFACSACGKYLDEYVCGGEWVSLVKTPNYCPSCGARMKGVSEE